MDMEKYVFNWEVSPRPTCSLVLHAKLLRDWVVSALYNTLQWHVQQLKNNHSILTSQNMYFEYTHTHTTQLYTGYLAALVPLLLAINTLTLASWASLFCTGYLAALVPLLLAINTITLASWASLLCLATFWCSLASSDCSYPAPP